MGKVKILAIGDNVCDKYLSRGKMYPGGQCVNTCVYAGMNGAEAAYLGKFGSDDVAEYIQKTLTKLAIDYSHSRHFQGENGFALVTLKNGCDRVFLGSNKGGISQTNPFDFTEQDFQYMKKYNLIYTNIHAYLEDDLQAVQAAGVPIAFDFSTKWTDKYLERVCPYIQIAIMSCEHLSDEKRQEEMKKAASYGVPIVVGTIGEKGSYTLYKDKFYFADAVRADSVIDTMGAGDSYFAAFLCSMLEDAENGDMEAQSEDAMAQRLQKAMSRGAAFAAKICGVEGAFGYGTPITGKTEI